MKIKEVLPLMILALATAVGCEEDHQFSSAYRIKVREQLIGGPTALGEVGDFMLENSQIRVVIEQIGYNRGSGVFGGSLIDADLVRSDNEESFLGGTGHDQFGEMFPAFLAEMIDPEEIIVRNDGADGNPAVVEVKGRGGEFVTMARYANQFMTNSYTPNLSGPLKRQPATSDPNEKQIEFSTKYILPPGARHLRIESSMTNVSAKLLSFPDPMITGALSAYLGNKLDVNGFHLPAGHVVGWGNLSSVFVPGIGYDLKFGLVDAYFNKRIQFPALPGISAPFLASSGPHGVSYGFAASHSDDNFIYSRDKAQLDKNQPTFYGKTPSEGGHKGDELLLFYASGFSGVYTHQIPKQLRPAFCDFQPQNESQRCDEFYACEETCRKRFECNDIECGRGDLTCERKKALCIKEQESNSSERQDAIDTCKNKCAQRVTSCKKMTKLCKTDWANIPSTFTYTNYFIVGDGDVSSIQQELYNIEKTPVIGYNGQAVDELSNNPIEGATVYAYSNCTPKNLKHVCRRVCPSETIVDENGNTVNRPFPSKSYSQDYVCIEAEDGVHANSNIADNACPLIYSQTTTGPNGEFKFVLPEDKDPNTSYCFRVEQSHHPIGDLQIPEKGKLFQLIAPATGEIKVNVIDNYGRPLPSKISAVGVHPLVRAKSKTNPITGELNPLPLREFFFDQRAGQSWRTSDLIPDTKDPSTRRYIEDAKFCGADGICKLTVTPGTYEVYISRGPTYTLWHQKITVEKGKVVTLLAKIEPAYEPTGYLSGDFHLHAAGSIDSGLDNNIRVMSVAAEGVDLAIATDHNYVTDYKPFIYRLGLENWLASVVGLELTTFEGGHFNAFPIDYRPGSMNRGSIPWQDLPPQTIFDDLHSRTPPSLHSKSGRNIVQVNHPRMNIMGYFSQHYLDTFTTQINPPFEQTKPSLLSAIAAPNGPAFVQTKKIGKDTYKYNSVFSWDFEALEVYNGKHMEYMRTLRMPYDKNAVFNSKNGINPDNPKIPANNAIPPHVFEQLKRKYADAIFAGGKLDAEVAKFNKLTDSELAKKKADENVDNINGKDSEYTKLVNNYLYGKIKSLDLNGITPNDPQIKIEADKWAKSQIPDKDTILCDGDSAQFTGVLDDWYNLLNYPRMVKYKNADNSDYVRDQYQFPKRREEYRKITATGNSDSHGDHFDETGYPRNFFYAGTSDPRLLTEDALVNAINDHNVFVSMGPFATFSLTESDGTNTTGEPNVMGSEFIPKPGTKKLLLTIDMYAPKWVGITRFRIVKNGEAYKLADSDNSIWQWVYPNQKDKEYYEKYNHIQKRYIIDTPSKDSWFVLEVESDKSLFPVVSPQDKPAFSIDGVIQNFGSSFGLGGGGAIPGMAYNELFPVRGFGFSNPIWVDSDGHKGFDPPQPTPPKCKQGSWMTALTTYGSEHAEDEFVNNGSPSQKPKIKRLTPSYYPMDKEKHYPFQRPRGEKRDVRVIFDIYGGHGH